MRLGSLLGPRERPEAAEPPSPPSSPCPRSVRRSWGSWRGFAVPRISYRRTALGRPVGPSEGRSAFPRPSGLDRSGAGQDAPQRPRDSAGRSHGGRRVGVAPIASHRAMGSVLILSPQDLRTAHVGPQPPRCARPRPSVALPVGGQAGLRAVDYVHRRTPLKIRERGNFNVQ